MGLGKTIQVIGLLVAVLKLEAKMDAKPEFLLKKSEKHRTYEGTALIVVPPAVLLNWKKELETWGHFRIGCIEKASERIRILEQADAKQLDVVLATYTGVRTHLDDYLYITEQDKDADEQRPVPHRHFVFYLIGPWCGVPRPSRNGVPCHAH